MTTAHTVDVRGDAPRTITEYVVDIPDDVERYKYWDEHRPEGAPCNYAGWDRSYCTGIGTDWLIHSVYGRLWVCDPCNDKYDEGK